MSEKDYIEDNYNRTIYYRIPTMSCCSEGLWVLSALFTKWRKNRKAKKQGQVEAPKEALETEQPIESPERKLETITI
jgi:hypothetical protein